MKVRTVFLWQHVLSVMHSRQLHRRPVMSNFLSSLVNVVCRKCKRVISFIKIACSGEPHKPFPTTEHQHRSSTEHQHLLTVNLGTTLGAASHLRRDFSNKESAAFCTLTPRYVPEEKMLFFPNTVCCYITDEAEGSQYGRRDYKAKSINNLCRCTFDSAREDVAIEMKVEKAK